MVININTYGFHSEFVSLEFGLNENIITYNHIIKIYA